MRIKQAITMFMVACAGFAQAADALVINVDEANAPFMYAKDGKPAGIYPALIEAAFKKMNVPVTVKAVPWSKAVADCDSGAAGVGGIYKNAEREKKYDYSDQVFVERLQVFFNKAAVVNFTKMDDLKGKKIGVLKGWSYGDDFDKARKGGAITCEDADSDAQNFAKLDQRHLDAAVAVFEAGTALLPKYKSVAYAAASLSRNPTFITFNKSAGKTALLKQFDAAVKDIKASGEFQKIVQAELAK
jgi:polar amino acid transport system substrate-binding protein